MPWSASLSTFLVTLLLSMSLTRPLRRFLLLAVSPPWPLRRSLTMLRIVFLAQPRRPLLALDCTFLSARLWLLPLRLMDCRVSLLTMGLRWGRPLDVRAGL